MKPKTFNELHQINWKDEFRFPDGSLNFKIRIPTKEISKPSYIQLQKFDYEKILLLGSAIEESNRFVGIKTAYIPYIPSRQDRVCNTGEPFTIKAIFNFLAASGFDYIVTLELHSDVLKILGGERIINLTYEDVFDYSTIDPICNDKPLNVVAPDAGATKRTEVFIESILKHYPRKQINLLQGLKKRNIRSGRIEEIGLADKYIDLHKEQCLVVDDVCANGGTFLGIRESLEHVNAGEVSLLLAHADEKNGLDKLAKFYDNIYVTNSQKFEVTEPNIKITDIFHNE